MYLVYAQGIAAIDYDLAVSMGTQESASKITEVGVAFWYGFALADLLTYIPLLAAGLIGIWLDARWRRPVFAAALGITIYWPVVALAAVFTARNANGWSLPDNIAYWTVLPAIVLWAIWALWRTLR
jgi:hypothetical protein